MANRLRKFENRKKGQGQGQINKGTSKNNDFEADEQVKNGLPVANEHFHLESNVYTEFLSK